MLVYNAILMIFIQLNGWELLSTTQWSQKYDDLLMLNTDAPVFSDHLLRQEGQKITLEGFVIPLEAGKDQRFFVLSRFPYQSCFFCGAAGPETVAEIYPTVPVSDLEPDQQVIVTGILTLNQDDPLHLSFIVKEAVVR